MSTAAAGCPLCDGDGGLVVARTAQLRIVRVLDEPAHPAFYRVIWQAHIAEFSDLPSADRHACMDAVTEVERVLRAVLRPTKVNLASLGNVVPHLHWHVIARFEGDSHFPAPIWAAARREAQPVLAQPMVAVDAAIAQAFAQSLPSAMR
ncbi:HIT domain-containing protein [Pelomonas sp. HMWF004]|nr:HIT domain-containing protein [Pelomonas sp. HMWF004]